MRNFNFSLPYVTQWQDAKREAVILNRRLFKLPKKYLHIHLRPMREFWGWAVQEEDGSYHLDLNTEYPSYFLFRNTIAHELVHMWQYENGFEDRNHDNTFFRWHKPLKEIGYQLRENY